MFQKSSKNATDHAEEQQKYTLKQRKIENGNNSEKSSEDRLSNQRDSSPSTRKGQNQNLRIPSIGKKKGNNSPGRKKKSRVTAKGDKKPRTPPSGAKHDIPMGKNDLYFALDCEMVGIGPYGAESALARVSIVNWDCEVVLDTFVKVPVPVTDYRTFVSGVRSEDIESSKAIELKDVRSAVQNILRGKILIGHGLENDLKALNITHPWCDTRDTATYAPYMRQHFDDQNRCVMLPKRLKDLAWEELGKKIQVLGDAHSPIEDGVAALELYKAVRPQWEAHVAEHVKKANDLENSRLRKAANFTKRRVQPMPMYHPMQSKQFHSRNSPIYPANIHSKEHAPMFFVPIQGPRYFVQYGPQISQYSMTGPPQQNALSNMHWRQHVPSQ